MESAPQLLGPLILLPLMFVVGLQLTLEDFRRVAAAPVAVVGGTLGQLLLLPAMTWALAAVFGLSPALTAGALLLAATPGAGMSNVMAAVSGANVALSVTLTAVASALSVLTFPLLAAFGLGVLLGDGLDFEVPVARLVSQLVFFLALPIAAGMWVRARRPEASIRYVGRANRFAVIAILVATVLGALSGTDDLPSGSDLAWAVAGAVSWTGAAMSIGWVLATLLGLDERDRFTFLIEFSARNLALTIVVAVGSLGRLDLAVFAGAYSLTGFPLVILLALLRGRLVRRADAA